MKKRSSLRDAVPSQAIDATGGEQGNDPGSARFSSGVYSRDPRPVPVGAVTTLDLDGYLASVSGHPISVRPMEQRLLALLAACPDRVLRTEALVTALYGNIPVDAGRIRLKRLVADIRSRLGPDFADRLRTVHGVGLVLQE